MSIALLIKAAEKVGLSLTWQGGKVIAKGKRTPEATAMIQMLRPHKQSLELALRPAQEPDPPVTSEVASKAAQVIERIKVPWMHIDAAWRESSRRYYDHHTTCQTCIGAGQGRGQRCQTGEELWAAYEHALESHR